ncbi:hypothetical protein CSC27_0697 [Pseudomonas aeruginosa]|nr:hypothetical protein CSC27_0697 [Pseudomonas aeruginosa]
MKTLAASAEPVAKTSARTGNIRFIAALLFELTHTLASACQVQNQVGQQVLEMLDISE